MPILPRSLDKGTNNGPFKGRRGFWTDNLGLYNTNRDDATAFAVTLKLIHVLNQPICLCGSMMKLYAVTFQWRCYGCEKRLNGLETASCQNWLP